MRMATQSIGVTRRTSGRTNSDSTSINGRGFHRRNVNLNSAGTSLAVRDFNDGGIAGAARRCQLQAHRDLGTELHRGVNLLADQAMIAIKRGGNRKEVTHRVSILTSESVVEISHFWIISTTVWLSTIDFHVQIGGFRHNNRCYRTGSLTRWLLQAARALTAGW